MQKKTKLSGRFWAALAVFSFIGQVAWVVENMYFNVFIYKMFHAGPGDISTMVAASAVAATLTTLLVGALSDKVGKRKIFICLGYLLWGVSIWCFAWIRSDVIRRLFPAASAASVGVSLVIIMDCVMTFFGSSANDACFNAWLTDSTDSTNRGAAEGVNAMMPLIAVLAVFGGFMGFDLNRSDAWVTIFTIIGAAVCAVGVLGVFLIREPARRAGEKQSYFRNIFYGFRPSVMRRNRILYVALLAYAIFGIAIQIFMPYLILYYNVSLAMDNYVLVMAPAILIAAIITAFYGKLYDRAGFRAAILPSAAMLILGCLCLFLFRRVPLVFAGSLLMLTGDLTGMAVFGAILRDYTPEGRAGQFQGQRIVSQVLIPMVIGPAAGARILRSAAKVVNDDGTSSFIPNGKIFLASAVAALVMIPVLLWIFRLQKKEKRHED